MGDLSYLEPDFDPTSFTIPKLRSLLVEYDINYPSSAKKAQLVELFEEKIRPQAKRILSAHARTKPSSRGIKDVPSSQASVVDEDPLPPPTKSPTKRKSRRVTEGPVEVDDEPTPRVPASAPAKRVSSKQARTSDQNADGEPQRRRSRKSAAKVEDPEQWHGGDADSPFTSDNPFQSGSSPPPPESRERRRRTVDPTEQKVKRKSSEGRRRTDVHTAPQGDGALVRTRKTYEVPVARLKREEDEAVPAGEEFTPEEQLELVRTRAANGEVDILPPRRRKARPSRAAGALKMFSSFGGLATLLGLAAVWRQEKFEVGYCGIGRPSAQIAGIDIPEWAEVIRPQCEPCPPHAYCYSDLRTECEPDFVLRQHPLALNGLVPLPPTCEPDSEKQRRVKAVADRAVEELRIRNAEYECGDLKDTSGKAADSSQIPEEELKEAVSTKRRKGMSQEEFEDLWKAAIGDIASRDEVVAGSDGTSRTLASTSLARVGFGCYVRRSVRAALVRHLWELVGVLLFLASLSYGRYTITAGRREESEAKRLASYAFDRLATQAALHAADGTKYPEGFISMANMRDDPTLSKSTIGRSLWEKVQKKVEKNSNVRPMVREGRNGDIGRVWEWIGPVAAIEDGSSSRRQSGRYSMGAGYESSINDSPYQVEPRKQEMVERRSWNEGRPIY